MNTTVLYGIAAVPAIIGLVEVCKDIGLPTRFSPAVAVLLGIMAALAQVYADASASHATYVQAVFTGIALGLSASGLYAGAKTVFPVRASQ